MSERHRTGYLPHDRTGNRLLVQSSLGKNKPTNYAIPDQDFVYGRLTPSDPQKTADVLYKWKYHQNSANKNIGKVKDLVGTNKEAIKHLLHTSHQNYDFRKTQTKYIPVIEGKQNVKIYLPGEQFRYGKPGELEDPVKLVIANNYGEEDYKMRHTMYTTKITQDQIPPSKLKSHITKNHSLVKEATYRKMMAFNQTRRATSKDHWKINKFVANAHAKVDHIRKKRPQGQDLFEQLKV